MFSLPVTTPPADIRLRAWVLTIGLTAVTGLAQVRIISNDPGGDIQWTNLVTTSAVYRVDWAAPPALQWQPLGVVTNQTRLATSNRVARLPVVFLRVAWTNAATLFEFSAFDAGGNLLAAGWLNGGGCPAPADGTWALAKAGNLTNTAWPAIAVGKGCYLGGLEGTVNLNPGTGGEQVLLESSGIFLVESNALVGTGSWRHATTAGTGASGAYRVVYRTGF
jgi:hypothetical protein